MVVGVVLVDVVVEVDVVVVVVVGVVVVVVVVKLHDTTEATNLLIFTIFYIVNTYALHICNVDQ